MGFFSNIWNGITGAVKGVTNVLSGKSWSGEDPSAIKAQANQALAEVQAQQQKLLAEQQEQANAQIAAIKATTEESSKKNKLLLLGVVGVLGVFMFISFNKGRL